MSRPMCQSSLLLLRVFFALFVVCLLWEIVEASESGSTPTTSTTTTTTTHYWVEETPPSRSALYKAKKNRDRQLEKKKKPRPFFWTYKEHGMPDFETPPKPLEVLKQMKKEYMEQLRYEQSLLPHPARTDLWSIRAEPLKKWWMWWQRKQRDDSAANQDHNAPTKPASFPTNMRLQFAPNGFVMDLNTGYIGKWTLTARAMSWTLPVPMSSTTNSPETNSNHASCSNDNSSSSSTYSSDSSIRKISFRADFIANPFGSHPKMVRGIAMDITPCGNIVSLTGRRLEPRNGWFRPILASFSASGIGDDVFGRNLTKVQYE